MAAIVFWTSLSCLLGLALYYSGAAVAVSGLGENRNRFACFVNVAIVCAYMLHQSSRSGVARSLLAVSFPILFLGIALTFSRAGLLVLSVTLILMWYRLAREKRIGMLIGSMTVLLSLSLFLPDEFWNRVSSIVPTVQRQEGTFGTRMDLWEVGMSMVKEKPIIGVGVGNFEYELPRYGRGEMATSQIRAHNSYVTVAAESGLIGLSLFILLHWLALRYSREVTKLRAIDGLVDIASLAVALEVSLIVVMVAGLSGSFEAVKHLWIFFGLSVAVSRMMERYRATETSTAAAA